MLYLLDLVRLSRKSAEMRLLPLLKIKFGDTDSVGRMKQLVHIYFGRLFE